MKPTAIGLAASLAIGLSTACWAEDMVASQQSSGTKIAFLLKDNFSSATMTISGPNGFFAHAFAKNGAIAVDLRRFGAIDDGTFTYQVTAAANDKIRIRTPLDNGRDRIVTERPRSASMSGTFSVVRGEIVATDATKTERRDVPAAATKTPQ